MAGSIGNSIYNPWGPGTGFQNAKQENQKLQNEPGFGGCDNVSGSSGTSGVGNTSGANGVSGASASGEFLTELMNAKMQYQKDLAEYNKKASSVSHEQSMARAEYDYWNNRSLQALNNGTADFEEANNRFEEATNRLQAANQEHQEFVGKKPELYDYIKPVCEKYGIQNVSDYL